MANYFKRLLSPYKLDEIFTPNTIAKLTYVKRETIDYDLDNYINLPGKQIFIYGHSGSGKTTLLRNKLCELNRNFIITHCESNTTFDNLVLQAFDQLEKFYIIEKLASKNKSVALGLKSEYLAINSQIDKKNEFKEGRIVPVQLTAQKLAKFLGQAETIWIIEDFHKLHENEKKKVADVIKIFVDAANDYKFVKIICIGAVGTARELIELDNNLSNRVAELYVPLLSDFEIKEIVKKGFNFLNIYIDDNLIEKIVYYSNNLASVTHGLCYDICCENDIKNTNIIKRRLSEDSFFRSVNSFVRKNSDTFKKIFDEISSKKFGWYILKTFENSERNNLTVDQIYNSINKNKRPERSELQDYLNLLSTLQYREILKFDQSSSEYCISSPLFSTFIKMKMALDKSEQEQIQKRKLNKINDRYNLINRKNELIFDDEFFERFNIQLDKIISQRIERERLTNNIEINYNKILYADNVKDAI